MAVAVNVYDMSAELWQEDAYVHFRLRMDSEVSHCIATGRDSTANTENIAPRFPPNLHLVCIDDSFIARKALESILNQEGDTCIDWTSQYCWTNGWNCLWRGHSVYQNRPLSPQWHRFC
jgi:hypothetical protein